MFKSQRAWFGWGSKQPKTLHSLDQLKYLHNVMLKNQTVTEANKTLLVETLRSITEILIWGDQNDSSVFDFFLERNMLSFFLSIMKQSRCGSYVCVQLLQTLNILFENIRNETSLYYLLSNNHVNSIIVHKFDFSDEEVMAYYISFLKTLSLKLNTHTIHFFFNEHTNDFPLYTEGIKFFNHSEKMVRIAVRTLTLNVFKVEEESMLKFITDHTAVPYFSNLVWFIGNHVLEIDNCLHSKEKTQQMVVKLDDLVAEHLDHLHYLNDILLLNISDLNAILTEHLMNRLLIPLYIYSLIDPKNWPATSSPAVTVEGVEVRERDEDPGRSSPSQTRISRLVSLFLLSQVFLIISFEPLVQELLNIFQKGTLAIFRNPSFTPPPETLEESLIQVAKSSSPNCSSCGDDPSCPMTSTPKRSPMKEDGPPSDNQSFKSTSSQVQEMVQGSPVHRGSSRELQQQHPLEEQNFAWMTDEQKALALKKQVSSSISDRPFLDALFQCLDTSQSNDDHTFIFSLCLIYAIVHNKGLPNSKLGELISLSSASETDSKEHVTEQSSEESSCQKLLNQLISMFHLCCQFNSRIRLVTLEMSILLLKRIVLKDGKSILPDSLLASIEQAREESALIVRNVYRSEEESIFLDLFEEEFEECSKRKLNVEYLMMDANLLLPPNQLTSLMMNGVDLTRRLPCADVERARYAIRVFFLLRDVSLTLRSERETQLPLIQEEACVKIDQLLDLSSSDLIACTVVMKDGTRLRRFMVVDSFQLILIEPDGKKLGFGVSKFVSLLQDVEVTADKDDSRSLHIVTRDKIPGKSGKRVSLTARFVFDDHIRCMAAKQRLTKGKLKARQRKMHQIARIIELGTHSFNSKRVSHLVTRDMTRSHSQEGFNRKTHHHHAHHQGSTSSTSGQQRVHKPLHRTSVPGLAVLATPGDIKPEQGGRRASRDSSKGRKEGGGGGAEGETSSSSLERSDEMIPMEDFSPKSSRKTYSSTGQREARSRARVHHHHHLSRSIQEQQSEESTSRERVKEEDSEAV